MMAKTLHTRWRTLLVSCVAWVALVNQVDSLSTCQRTDVCKCQSDQGLIDLTPLDSTSGTPSFDGIFDPTSGYTFSYNPCTPYNQNACSGVAICQYSSSFSYAVGKHIGNEFAVEGGSVVVTYKATDSFGTTRTGKVTLVCNQQEQGKLQFLGESTTSPIYKFQLTSKYACPSGGGGGGGSYGGISTGSLLCILLVVFILVYLVVGTLYMSVRRGATGVERVPNVSFWKELPLLIKDGFVFTIKCGKHGAGYNEI